MLSAIAIAVLGLSACSNETSGHPEASHSTTTASAPATTAPKTTTRTSTPRPTSAAADYIPCGAASNGLGVLAATAKGESFCAQAVSVANTYITLRNQNGDTTEDLAVPATPDDWTCGQRDGNPNPYVECVNSAQPTERLKIVS